MKRMRVLQMEEGLGHESFTVRLHVSDPRDDPTAALTIDSGAASVSVLTTVESLERLRDAINAALVDRAIETDRVRAEGRWRV